MKRILFCTFIALFCTTISAQQPIIRTHVEPASNILVGQPVHLVITVLVPNYFTGSPDFPEIQVENAIVVMPQDRPSHTNEQINNISYAGISVTYTLYPQQPGEFHFPNAIITVPYAAAPPQTTTAKLHLPVLSFHADVPASARSLNYFLPTTQLTMQQKWSVPLANLHAGMTIERTILVTASKMQAMLIPPLSLEAPSGIRIYPEAPSVQDQKTDRGDFISGRRIQSAKYFIEKEGDYTLPAITLQWWNISTNRLVTATLPAIHFTATPNPNPGAELPPEPEAIATIQHIHINLWTRYKFWIRIVAPGALACLLLLWIAWHYLPHFRRKWIMDSERRRHSEPVYFSNLQRACRSNRASDAYQAFVKWLQIAHPQITMQEYLHLTNDATLTTQINSLSNFLYAGIQNHPAWQGSTLASLLAQQRKSHSSTAKQDRMQLNP